jgi:hypothetical protein
MKLIWNTARYFTAAVIVLIALLMVAQSVLSH